MQLMSAIEIFFFTYLRICIKKCLILLLISQYLRSNRELKISPMVVTVDAYKVSELGPIQC